MEKIISCLILFLSLSANCAGLNYDDAVADCKSRVRWGYFKHQKYDYVNYWHKKDLTGKFKSEEACEADRAKKKNDTEKCQSFIVGAKADADVYDARAGYSADKFDVLILFRNQKKCEEALATGGKFFNEDSIIEVKALKDQTPAERFFVGPCKKVRFPICNPDLGSEIGLRGVN